MCWCAEVLGRIRDIRGTFTAARFPPRRNGLQIGATQPKTSWQHLDLLQKSRFDHPPEGRAADTQELRRRRHSHQQGALWHGQWIEHPLLQNLVNSFQLSR